MAVDKERDELVLAVETSCDETSAAVVAGGRRVLSDIIASQVPVHRRYGGVVPEIASRRHVAEVLLVVDEALRQAGVGLPDLAAVGVTCGPGLVGALLVGVAAAKALAFGADKPLVGVNHLEGHIFANFLTHPQLAPPFLCLVVSGGHTALAVVRDYNDIRLLGQTRDDAAGEAFDKIGRVLGLPYPAGPHIDRLARAGDAAAYDFPRALAGEHDLSFSFSGLKSAVINFLHTAKQRGEEVATADVAASFQQAVVDVLIEKTMTAAAQCGMRAVALAGGVAANSLLRGQMAAACQQRGLSLYVPAPILCTDNGAMIASRAYYLHRAGRYAGLDLNAWPNLPLAQP